jgi:hypothetical protein
MLARWLLLGAFVAGAAGCSSPSKRIEDLSTSPQPEPDARLEVDAIHVRDSGFVWDGETLSYAFTAENTTEDTSMEEAVVQVSVYGINDQPIGSDTGIIDFVLPGQVVAYAAHLPLREEPGRIALSFTAENKAKVESARAFDLVAGKFEATGYGGRVVAAIVNPYERELRRLKVVAILRDEGGSILNGGEAVLELLPALGESTITVDILGVLPSAPVHVDVYTMFSAETVLRLR